MRRPQSQVARRRLSIPLFSLAACLITNTLARADCVSPADCDDGNPCTVDGCDQIKNECYNNPEALNYSRCPTGYDDDPCTLDMCLHGACVVTGCEVYPYGCCDDGNPCTREGCRIIYDQSGRWIGNECFNDSEGLNYNRCPAGYDNDPCTLDMCLHGACVVTGCEVYPPGCCDDGNPCTTDGCRIIYNESGRWIGNECVNDPAAMNGTICSDENLCTESDTCNGGTCMGTQLECDSRLCMESFCHPSQGCMYVPKLCLDPCSSRCNAASGECESFDPCDFVDCGPLECYCGFCIDPDRGGGEIIIFPPNPVPFPPLPLPPLIRGIAAIIDSRTVQLQHFTYDGSLGPIELRLGESNTYDSFLNGLVIGTVIDTTIEAALTLQLPPGRTVAGFDALSAWHPVLNVKLSSGTFARSLVQADFDDDGDVDLSDFRFFQVCLSGSDVPYDAGCALPDLDSDGDVDLDDFEKLFVRCLGTGGPGRPFPAGCHDAYLGMDRFLDLQDLGAFQRAFTGP